jgi:hypothetical protein
VATALRLKDVGLSVVAISRELGIPRPTINDWVRGKLPHSFTADETSTWQIGPLPKSYVYLLGLYLGDGCISAHPRDVYRLRIALDERYPLIIDECAAAMKEVMPANKVGRVKRKGCVEVSSFSKRWPLLFPQHGPGKKHERRIVLTDWQSNFVWTYPELLIRGLIQSDGCRFTNTGTNWTSPRYSFTNLSVDIRRIFADACDLLGLRWTQSYPHTVYVSRKADVERMDGFVGPKA